jgi:hypothetical protein
MTPPIGEPKATATPAALAAVKISLILPPHVSSIGQFETGSAVLTLTARKSAESAGNEVSYGASNVHGWALFAYGESRGNHEGLFRFRIEPSKRGERSPALDS